MAKKKHESITLTFGCLQGWRVPNSVVAVVEDEADFLFPSLLAGSLINRQSVSLAALNALLKHVNKVLQIAVMSVCILVLRPHNDCRPPATIFAPYIDLPSCIFMQQGLLQSFDLRRGVGRPKAAAKCTNAEFLSPS